MKIGQWLYFGKKGKRGKMIGNVLGRGYYLGQIDGRYVFTEGKFWCTFTPIADDIIVYSLGSNQNIDRKEAKLLLSQLNLNFK